MGSWKRQEQWEQLPLLTQQRLSEKIARQKAHSQPRVIELPNGWLRLSDKHGYYRDAKSWADATPLVQQLLGCRNNVMFLPGFHSSKWKTPTHILEELEMIDAQRKATLERNSDASVRQKKRAVGKRTRK